MRLGSQMGHRDGGNLKIDQVNLFNGLWIQFGPLQLWQNRYFERICHDQEWGSTSPIIQYIKYKPNNGQYTKYEPNGQYTKYEPNGVSRHLLQICTICLQEFKEELDRQQSDLYEMERKLTKQQLQEEEKVGDSISTQN